MFAKLMPRLAALSLALLLQGPAHAGDAMATAPSTSNTRAAIEQAISAEKSRRTKAVVGTVVGGAIILTGAVASSVAMSQNDDDRRYGRAGNRNEATGILIGAAVGLPVLGISLYQFFDAQNDIRQLRRQSATLSFTEDRGAPGLKLAMTF